MKLRDKILIAIAYAITMGLIVFIGSSLGGHSLSDIIVW